MQLSSETLMALDAWIETSTWYKTNEEDNHRFYRFIFQLSKDEGYHDNAAELLEFIKRRTKISSGLQAELDKRIHLTDSIVEYQRFISSRGL